MNTLNHDWRLAVLALSLSVITTGCFSDAQQRLDESKNNLYSLARIRWFSTAAIEYKKQHDEYPESLATLQSLYGPDKGSEQLRLVYSMTKNTIGPVTFEELLQNPYTKDSPGYEFVAPAETDSSTPIVYQLKEGERAENLPIGRLDGSIHPTRPQSG